MALLLLIPAFQELLLLSLSPPERFLCVQRVLAERSHPEFLQQPHKELLHCSSWVVHVPEGGKKRLICQDREFHGICQLQQGAQSCPGLRGAIPAEECWAPRRAAEFRRRVKGTGSSGGSVPGTPGPSSPSSGTGTALSQASSTAEGRGQRQSPRACCSPGSVSPSDLMLAFAAGCARGALPGEGAREVLCAGSEFPWIPVPCAGAQSTAREAQDALPTSSHSPGGHQAGKLSSTEHPDLQNLR